MLVNQKPAEIAHFNGNVSTATIMAQCSGGSYVWTDNKAVLLLIIVLQYEVHKMQEKAK